MGKHEGKRRPAVEQYVGTIWPLQIARVRGPASAQPARVSCHRRSRSQTRSSARRQGCEQNRCSGLRRWRTKPSKQPGRSQQPSKKIFCSDDPRGLSNYFLFLCLSVSDALPIAPALPVPFFSGRWRRPVFSLGLPPRPSPRSLPASTAAITLPCLPGPKASLASFEQTPPRPWAAGHTLPPTGLLIFGMTCRILSRAHGR